MKNFPFISAILLTANLLFGQWNNYNVITENTELFEIHFTDPMNGWMVGHKADYGLIIYHSIDGGNTLEVQYESSAYGGYPSSIFFVNTITGWVAGDGVILHTTDGGQTWNEQGTGISSNGGLDVFFINEYKGWVAGSHTILKTEDGGVTWETQNFASASLLNIHFADEYHGWAVGWYPGGSGWENGIFLRTTNGGNSWTQTIMEEIRLEDVFFISPDEGWMIGEEHQTAFNYDPRIYHTIDGGVNWDLQYYTGNGESWDMNIFFIDSIHGWATYGWTSNHVLFTEDGGENWIERNDIINLDGVNSIFFSDMQHGFMVGSGVFLRTQNSGEAWAIKGFFNKPIESVSFSDALHGMALIGQWIISGYAYYIIKTDDGGENWAIIWPSKNNYMGPMQIFMHDSLHITMIPKGQGTSIYQSVNGGYSWDTISLTGNDNNWYCGRFINPDTGWVTRMYDNMGTSVFRTYDGGHNWEEFQISSDDYYISSIFFFPSSENSEFGCAVAYGYPGVIFITSDGGESWSQNYIWNGHLNDVFFTNETNGWVVGGDLFNNGTVILRSTDGGQNWIIQDSGTAIGLNSVWFTNEDDGWIAGSNGTILYTSNGGDNWEISPCPVEENLNSVCFIDEQAGWIGGFGSLLEYDDTWTEIKLLYESKTNVDILIYPNPVLSSTTISFKTEQKKNVGLSIYNSLGKNIRKQTVEDQIHGEYHWQIDLSGLNAGIYFLRLQLGNEIRTKKIIKVD